MTMIPTIPDGRRVPRPVLALLAVALTVGACTFEPRVEDDPLDREFASDRERRNTPGALTLEEYRTSARSTALPLRAGSYVQGIVSMGDSYSRYTAWFKGALPSVIVEDLGYGDYGDARATYWFANRLLVYYQRHETLLDLSDPNAPHPNLVEVEIGFVPGGEMGAGRKLVNGIEVELTPQDALAVLERSDLLADSARVVRRRTEGT